MHPSLNEPVVLRDVTVAATGANALGIADVLRLQVVRVGDLGSHAVAGGAERVRGRRMVDAQRNDNRCGTKHAAYEKVDTRRQLIFDHRSRQRMGPPA